ncbi:HTH-type transcriptional activator Btr [Pontiella desulfatans]|uniref:HTH-type transcriptional activator Btr n=1 Tax=Pontiella desulfatans TaxID=2750659 RepID=A0A6C2U288_PONDE|nr:AraC family transcriptional regulator [Pontiella desulfatans]VGO14013.1 HTH-type transcriptional activator Btr [Pontiella desulfatans]
MNKLEKSWSCYLPQSPEAEEWGLFVLDAGYTVIPPNTPYPPGQHPDDHMSVTTDRTLDSCTLVYITRGGGIFESRSGGKHTIREGDLFVLHPGEWHRYQPNPETGWDEYWVEFDGEQARRIMGHDEFSLKKPVLSIGDDDQILRLFIEIAEATQTQSPGFEHIIAAQTSQIVARILANLRCSSAEAREMEALIRRARLHILKNAEQTIGIPDLARKLGISYSAFRQRFKQITGLPPGQFQIQIRLNKARNLLRNSPLSVADIAEQLGFESIYYFSRLFKKKTGCSPLAYRKQADAPKARSSA